MQKSIILVATVLSLSLSASASESIRGKRMDCSFSETFGSGIIKTAYRFLADSDHEVLEQSSSEGNSLRTYKLENSVLTVFDNNPDHNAVYDISDPNNIVRKFNFCIFPGEGGGDAQTICELETETCFLQQ